MSTRTLLPLGLIVTILAGFMAAFYYRSPELQAEYDEAIISYEKADKPISSMQQQLSDISRTYSQIGETAGHGNLTPSNTNLQHLYLNP